MYEFSSTTELISVILLFQLLNYLTNFLKQGPGQFGDYCYRILQRTLQVGSRKQPPTTVELEASKF